MGNVSPYGHPSRRLAELEPWISTSSTRGLANEILLCPVSKGETVLRVSEKAEKFISIRIPSSPLTYYSFPLFWTSS